MEKGSRRWELFQCAPSPGLKFSDSAAVAPQLEEHALPHSARRPLPVNASRCTDVWPRTAPETLLARE